MSHTVDILTTAEGVRDTPPAENEDLPTLRLIAYLAAQWAQERQVADDLIRRFVKPADIEEQTNG